MATIPRRGAAKALAAALLLLALLAPLSARSADPPGRRGPGVASYEQRSSAEKTSRSRYRRLEVASAILIILGGGAAIYWAIRKK